jgi:hypothetical protein
VAATVFLMVAMRVREGWFFSRYGDRVIEPELKGAFAALLLLTWLGRCADVEPVLPTSVLGLAVAPVRARHRELQSRFRVVSFALLTPCLLLRAGQGVSLPGGRERRAARAPADGEARQQDRRGYPLARSHAPEDTWAVSLLPLLQCGSCPARW